MAKSLHRSRSASTKRQPVKRRRLARQPTAVVEPASSGLAPGMQAIAAHLAVANVTASIDFLERVMSFTRGVTLADTDGQLRYAEMRHGDSVVILVRRGDVASPSGGAPALYTYVADVDRAIARARDVGAGTGEVEEQPWGDRVCAVTDPDGYRWMLATFKKLVAFD